jgi:hypothetical protein
MANNKVDIYSLADIIFNKRTFSEPYFKREFVTRFLGVVSEIIYLEEHVVLFEEKEFFLMIQAFTLNLKGEGFFHVIFHFKPKNEEDFKILTFDKIKDYLKSEIIDFNILNFNSTSLNEEEKFLAIGCYISNHSFKDFYFRFSMLEHFEKNF